jgi:hypothetical protein
MNNTNANTLTYTSSDYKISFTAGAGNYTPITLEEVKYNVKKESEFLHVVGSDYPVALKGNAVTYEGNFIIQAGELENYIKTIVPKVDFLTDIIDGVIAITAYNNSFSKTFNHVIFDSHDGGTKAKDKDSKITVNWKALSVK